MAGLQGFFCGGQSNIVTVHWSQLTSDDLSCNGGKTRDAGEAAALQLLMQLTNRMSFSAPN